MEHKKRHFAPFAPHFAPNGTIIGFFDIRSVSLKKDLQAFRPSGTEFFPIFGGGHSLF